MARPVPTLGALRPEYDRLFASAIIAPDWRRLARIVGERAVASRTRYEAIGMGIPWWWIAAVHSLEGDASFTIHLHNGDPLGRPTVNVPRNRPPGWIELPGAMRTWERSASDALSFDEVHLWKDWSIPGALYKAEAYNGWGYRRLHPNVLSPYLWSGTQHYIRGKFVRDGVWSSGAQSDQLGAAALWVWCRDNGIRLP